MGIVPLANLPEHLIDHFALGVLTSESDTLSSVMTRGSTTALQLTSTVAIGTSPFAITSTTVNTNLNADMVDGTHASAFGLVASALSQFASTTSAQLLGVISDEEGTGFLVFNTAPSFVTNITTPSVLATAIDSGALGASGTAFSDLFLASGGVINWVAGNVTLTHSSNALNLTANSVSLLDFTSTGYVFNEGGADIDMRWEGDTDINNIYLDASANKVIFGAASTGYTAKMAIIGNATDTYGLYVDRYDTTVTTNVGTGVVTYGFRDALGTATTSGLTPANIYAFSVGADQRRSQANLTVGGGSQQTYGGSLSVILAGSLTGSGWTAGQLAYWDTEGIRVSVADYMGDSSNTSDTRPDFYGGNFSAGDVSYIINKPSGFILKYYRGGTFSGDSRSGTLTAGGYYQNTYGGYFVCQGQTAGISTNYAGYFVATATADTNYTILCDGSLTVRTYGANIGTGTFDGGLIGNESGIDSDSRFEGDTATNLLVLDAGLDAVQIGTTTAGVIADFRTASIVFNEDGTADRDVRMEGDTDTDLLHLDTSTDSLGIGVAAPDTKLEVNTGATWGKQAVTIDQDDADQAFIDFQGTSAADLLNNISTFATEGGTVNYIKMEINGTAYWFRGCTAPTA